MKRRKIVLKLVSLGVVLTLTCNLFPVQILQAEEPQKEEEKEDDDIEEEEIAQEVIEINTADDLQAFADNCSLDSWSSNKLVLLNSDIDLSGIVFDSIPVFTGTFDGQNHTISGFQYSGDGYVAGLFRYIKKEGIVENLKLKGEVTASDEKECIGGLCGVNYGTIKNCSFQGNVSGRTTVGGIVGVNEGTGIIQNTSVGGRVTGYYSTGGIAGKNHGILSFCTNHASINNDSEWVEEDDEMGVGLFLSINVNDSETELFSGLDTGGIVGHSDGIITSCTNYGRIGYEHTGYNIGGIAGRQSGVVSLCTNNGTVYGRKDVGGIVGQMEPYIEVDEAESLRNAINKLHDLIEKTINDMGDGKNAVKVDLDNLTAYSDGAVDAGDALAGQIVDFVDENMDQVQAVTDRLDHVMEMLPSVFDDIYEAEDYFSNANSALMLIADDLKDMADVDGEYVETDYNRLSLLSTVGGSIMSMQYYPEEGETVEIMAEPDDSYILNSIRAVDAYGNGVNIQPGDNGYYTFVMPKQNVRVEAYFGYSSGYRLEAPEEKTGYGEEDLSDSRTDRFSEGQRVETETPLEDLENGRDISGEEQKNKTNLSEDESGSITDLPKDEPESITDSSENEPESAADSPKDEPESAADSPKDEPESVTESPEDEPESVTESPEDEPEGVIDTLEDEPDAEADRKEVGGAEGTDKLSDTSDNGADISVFPRAAKPVVKLSSNLSGNAYCETNAGTAALTVIPDDAYTVSGMPTVTLAGQNISVSKSDKGEYSYSFPVSDGNTYQVNIVFTKQDKADAVGSAKDNISNAIKEQQAAAETVNAIISDIQSSQSVSPDQLSELSKALEQMSDAVSAVMGSLTVISNIVGQQVLDGMENMGSDMETVLDHLQNAVDSVKSATRDTRSIVDYVNGQSNIHFSKLGGEFDVNRENLHDQLKGMSASIKSLSDNASNYSDVVNEDLKAVNDQINIIFNLLADNLTNYGEFSVEELYEDVDIEDTDSITTGKTDNCTNKGIIKGDINVGGIAGSMSVDEEDPEDSAAGSVEYQIGRKYFTKCIITNSVNDGYITAKKDGAGGIVGYMRHGIVIDSEGYGSVESTEGDYVGGICGESFTVIKRCYALCSVSGGKNVGGIAGFADTLQDCCAIVDCKASIGRKGAIAGQTVDYEDALNEGEVKVSGNYYVSDELYGIDNISYIGVAEPVSYEELLTIENLPTEFRHLKVIFRIDDLYLGTKEMKFGESLAELEYPAIPEKEGYYGVWPDYSGKTMSGNLLIQGEYKEDVTVVQSNEMDTPEGENGREKPYALVEQRFTEDTVLNAGISNITPPDKAYNKEYIIYDIELENAGLDSLDTFAVRLYNPYGDAVVFGYQNGIWTELESKSRGEYLQVNMTGTEESFCIMKKESKVWIIIICTAGGVAVVLLLTVLVRKVKSVRRKKNYK